MKIKMLVVAAVLFAVASAQEQQEFKVEEGVATGQHELTSEEAELRQKFMDTPFSEKQADFQKEDGTLPILGPATPTACKVVTTIVNGLCAFANYDGCEESVAYVQCICNAQRDKTKTLLCASSSLTTLLKGYCESARHY